MTTIHVGPEQAEKSSAMGKIDVQDVLLLAGFCGVETGIGFIYWPAALIIGGLICFGFAYLIHCCKQKGG